MPLLTIINYLWTNCSMIWKSRHLAVTCWDIHVRSVRSLRSCSRCYHYRRHCCSSSPQCSHGICALACHSCSSYRCLRRHLHKSSRNTPILCLKWLKWNEMNRCSSSVLFSSFHLLSMLSSAYCIQNNGVLTKPGPDKTWTQWYKRTWDFFKMIVRYINVLLLLLLLLYRLRFRK